MRLDCDEREVELLVVEEEEVGPQAEAVGGFGPTGHIEAVVELGDGRRGLVRRAEHVFVREQKPRRDHEACGAPALVARQGADADAADGACREQRAFEVELVNEVVRAEQPLELDLRRLSAAAREEACARGDGAWARLARDARRGVERVRCEYSFGQFFRAQDGGGADSVWYSHKIS